MPVRDGNAEQVYGKHFHRLKQGGHGDMGADSYIFSRTMPFAIQAPPKGLAFMAVTE